MTFSTFVRGSLLVQGKLEDRKLVENSLTIVLTNNTMQDLLSLLFYSSGNSCLSTSVKEEIKTKDDQAYAIIPSSNTRETADSISIGHLTPKESDPPKHPWSKLPESCSSVPESNNSSLTEGEGSNVESRVSGLEPGEVPAVPSGERNGFSFHSVCGNICFYCIYCVMRGLSESCAVHLNLAIGQK